MSNVANSIIKASECIRKARNLVVFTGAGMGKESGIDTFRGSKGLWSGFIGSLMLLYGGTPFGWSLTPGLTWSIFINSFYKPIAEAKPHEGYTALVKIREKLFQGDRMHIITMNVDGLHQDSGFPPSHVYEVHGTVRAFRCVSCALPIEISNPTVKPAPHCSSCGGYPRPDVTLFYEGLPEEPWLNALSTVRCMSEGDVMIVIGTSSVVYPAASLPEIAKRRGAVLVEINPDENTPLKSVMDIHIQAGAKESLTKIAELLNIDIQ